MEIKTPYPKSKGYMKKEFLKILLFIWMVVSLYYLYEMWVDIGWMADAMHAYMKFVMEHIGH